MIHLWTPGLTAEGLLTERPENTFSIANQNFVTDVAKTRKLVLHRSRSGIIRTFVQTDRKGNVTYRHSLQFEKISALKKREFMLFLEQNEGLILGYIDPLGKHHAVLVEAEPISAQSTGRASGLVDGEPTEDTWYSIGIKFLIVKSEGKLA